jgi:hypothetical protein
MRHIADDCVTAAYLDDAEVMTTRLAAAGEEAVAVLVTAVDLGAQFMAVDRPVSALPGP